MNGMAKGMRAAAGGAGGAVAASHHAGAREGAQDDAHDGAGGVCANCGTVRVGAFCHACGQSGHVHRTTAAIGHDILHGVFHFEGKFWATLPLLIRHPGALTRRYVHGERAKFVSPMALFLFSVFLLFAAVNRVSKPDVAGVAQSVAKARSELDASADRIHRRLAVLAAQRARQFSAGPGADTHVVDAEIAEQKRKLAEITTLAARLPAAPRHGSDRPLDEAAKQLEGVDTGWPYLNAQIEHVRENPSLYVYKLKMASYKFSWALIPISVPFIWLLFCWRRDVGLYDHAIFAIHSLSFMTLLTVGVIGLSLLGVQTGWLMLVLLVTPPLHMYRQLKEAYRLRRLGALWRTVALMLIVSWTSLLFFGLLLWLETE